MSFKNDRLGVKNNRKNNKGNIPLDLASSNTQKIQKKEKVNGIYFNYGYVFSNKW